MAGSNATPSKGKTRMPAVSGLTTTHAVTIITLLALAFLIAVRAGFRGLNINLPG